MRGWGKISRIERVLRFLAVGGLLFLLLPFTHWATRQLPPGDVFWQVRTGQVALDTGVMPSEDIFSYTVPGLPWNNHEWLYELGVAQLQRAWGWGGIRLFVLAIVLLTSVLLAVTIARRAGVGAALFVLTLFSLFCRYKMMPVPQLLSLALFLCAFAHFRGARLASSRLRLLALSLTMLLWGNCTAECFMFLPFVLLDQCALLMERRAGPAVGRGDAQVGRALLPARQHLLLLLLACVAPMVNPPWSSALEYALSGTSVNRAVNSEFASIFEPATTVTPFAKHIGMAIMLIYLVWAGRELLRSQERFRTLRILGPGLLAVLLAASFERNLWLLLLPGARMSVAAHDFFQRDHRQRTAKLATEIGLSVMLFARLCVVLGWTPALALNTLIAPGYRTQHMREGSLPAACIAPLIARAQPANVYALRLWANYLIFRVPQHRVFVDGRNREFPDSVHAAAQRILTGAPDALRLLDVSHTDFVLVPPGWDHLPAIAGGPFRPLASAPGCTLYARHERTDR